MKTKIILLLLSTAFLTSCKNDKADTQDAGKAAKPKGMSIAFDAIVKKDDKFQLFYNEDGSETFKEKDNILLDVKGSQTVQHIVFNLPEDAAPLMLRFDPSVNPAQDPITIQNFSINYFDKKLDVKGSQFYLYFYENDQIEFNKPQGIITPKKVEGKEYDPIFMANDQLKSDLSKLIKQ